jgi:hypothetical protein
MLEPASAKKKKKKIVEWQDSQSRFVASVSALQDSHPLLRLDLRVPPPKHDPDHGGIEITRDDLFLELQEILLLKLYQPCKTTIATDPMSVEVAVRVDNFWSARESGGNRGKPVKRGVVYVTGDTVSLSRLCHDQIPPKIKRGKHLSSVHEKKQVR